MCGCHSLFSGMPAALINSLGLLFISNQGRSRVLVASTPSDIGPIAQRELPISFLKTMTPSILIVGATGNTGRAVTQTLPKLLQSSSTLSGNRIIALTRSSSSPVARELAKLPGVEVIEQNWVEITVDWLRKH